MVDGCFGIWNQRYDEIDDLTRARKLPSPQLIGTPERTTLDLNALGAAGVEIVGRLAAVRDGRALFSGGLRNQFALADLKMNRLLDTFDDWAGSHPRDAEVGPPERFEPTRAPASSRLDLDLRSGEIRSVIWATGFRPDYSWLDVPVVDRKGNLRHDGGVVDAPGLYAIGLPVLRRRKSSFIHGAEDDARDLIDHLAGYLGGSVTTAVRTPMGAAGTNTGNLCVLCVVVGGDAVPRRRTTVPTVPARIEPPRIPTFAESSSGVPSNASVAMKRDMVNPMPPSQAHPCSVVQLTPAGNDASRNLTAASAAALIPSGFPSASPRITASVSRPPGDPLRATPAFESAKSGITTNAENPCSACSS